MLKKYLIGVDVGSTSVRAALVTVTGTVLKSTVEPISTWNPEHQHFEQSSQNIWNAVCLCVKALICGIDRESICAISFDATCSLVILGDNGEPLPVTRTPTNSSQNIILWMDHRAEEEVKKINATKHEVLKYVGGQISIEMQLPKLLWLKTHCYESTWKKLWKAFDLSDYLIWRCTGCDSRSTSTVVSKWNYDGVNMEWREDFFQQIDLSDLLEQNAAKIGSKILAPGTAVGKGLTTAAANDLCLLPGTIVASPLLDAHAGALGLFGCHFHQPTDQKINIDITSRLAMICGTSTCHISLTRTPCFAQGIWGPYRNVIFNGYYMNEGGQSATGILLDHIIETHPQYRSIKVKMNDNNIYNYLNDLLEKLREQQDYDNCCYLTKDLHVWPDFHGNRSPIADPNLKGMISGLNLNTNEDSLAILYLAFVQSLAYATRYIIDSLLAEERTPSYTLLFCGGLAKNPLYVQCHADICQLPCLVPLEKETMLLGTAMLGACAANIYDDLLSTSLAMAGSAVRLQPQSNTKIYHERKYQIFLEMLKDQRKYKQMMS